MYRSIRRINGYLIGALSGALIICALVGIQASAQITMGAIVGTLTDPSGAVVPNATVTIENVDTHVSRSALSNASGEYVFDLLDPGSYTVTAQASGFQRSRLPVTLVAGQRVAANVKLQVGQTSQTVEVTNQIPALQTQNSTLSNVVAEQAVQNLPSNGRNYLTLVQSTPGTSSGVGGDVEGGSRPDDRRQTSSVSANGQAEAFNNNMIDGMDNNEMEQGEVLLRPSEEGIAEVEVNTNDFSADVGRSGGAVINVVTKSGGNVFHGSLFEYLRNNVLNANDYFSNEAGLVRPEYHLNQFGGSIGGPIRKNKTFFFGDIERYSIVEGQPTGLVTVPTLFEEQNPGNLSDVGGPVIPASQLDPVALKYFELYPAPNVAGAGAINNFAATPRYTQISTMYDVRIDQHFTDKDSLFVRYSYNPVSTFTPGALPPVNGVQPGGNIDYPGPNNTEGQGVQVNDVHIFTPNLLLTVRGGATRLKIESLPLNYGNHASQKFGMPNADINNYNSGLAPMQINGYAPLGDSSFVPIIDVNNVFQGDAELTYTRGRHEIKVGGQLIRRQMNYLQEPFGDGQFNFSAAVPTSLADFLDGVPTSIERQNQLYLNYMRTWEPGLFAEDDWRVTQRLTLNIGLRWEYFSPITNAKNERSNFDINNFTMLVATPSDPSVGVLPDHKDFAPRVGFAVTLGHGMVLRGGVGFSYFPDDQGSSTNLDNPPFFYLFDCFPGSTTAGLICPAGIGTLSEGPPVPTTQSIAPDALTGGLNWIPFHNPSAYLEQFNLAFQKQLGQSVVTLAYVGELGRKMPWTPANGIEEPPPSTNPNPTLLYSSELPNVSGIYPFAPYGGSSYNALQVIFEHRYSRGLQLTASYTYDSNLDNIQDAGSWISAIGLNPTDKSYDWGYNDAAIRHMFNLQTTYALPFAKSATGLEHALLGSWQVNAVAYYHTGNPVTVMDEAFCPALINEPSVCADRPNTVPGQSFGLSHHNATEWFNIADFTPQAFGTAGDEHRNQIWAPADRDLDLSIFKEFPIRESLRMQFRAESFNATNTENFAPPNNGIEAFNSSGTPTNAGAFGSVPSTLIGANPRQYQFALKLLF